MSRARNGNAVDHFDLFPFISILVCTLGFLLMVTLSVVAISLGPGARMVIVPEPVDPTAVPMAIAGRPVGEKPLLIEWDGSQVTIHPSRVQVPWAAASENEGMNDSHFGQLLKAVRQNRGRYYVFVAVRPSGFGNLGDLIDLMDHQKIKYGYEPFEQDRPLGIKGGVKL